MTHRILEDGIPVAAEGKRALGITRNTKIWMVEQVVSFHSNRNLISFSDRKIFVQRQVKLRERRAPQAISSGIAKLPDRRYRISTGIKPALQRAHSRTIRTDAGVRVANQLRTFRRKQRLHIGIVEGEHWGKWHAAMNVSNSRNLPATQETSASRQLVNGIGHEIVPNVKI